MDSRLGSPEPPQPMSVGDVVNAGFRLYSNNFKPYLKVAAIATGWAIVPWVAILPIVLFFATTQQYYNLLGLLIPAWIVLLGICLARYLSEAAAIGRLAFTELTNEPETPQQARRATGARRWSFLWLSLLIGLLTMAVFVVMYILAALCIVAVFVVMGGSEFLQNPASAAAVNPTLIVLTVLIVLAVVFIFVMMAFWLGVRFSIADLPLAMEAGITAADSIGRSWDLTKRSVWRIFLVLLITSMVSLPVQGAVQVIMSVFQEITAQMFPPASFSYFAVSYTIASILGLSIGVLLLPLWQTIKAVIYYDLRSRREGLDLALRDWSDRLPPTPSDS